jgi:arginine deiminase
MKPNIFDETHPLKEVLVWGEPGIETLLGQLIPKSKSLFFSHYEVLEARREFRHMQAVIQGERISFTQAKEAFAKSAKKKSSIAIRELENNLLFRANQYYEMYREIKGREYKQSGIDCDIHEVYKNIQENIKAILEQDIENFGEAGAIKLNQSLSLNYYLPLSNIFYGRDQSQALTDKIVLSQLKWNIRKPEVQIFKEALCELGYQDLIEIENGIIEGGDIALLGNTCYIGIGARTTMEAVKALCLKIGNHLQKQGIEIVAVINKRHVDEANILGAPTDEHMRIMHLDMFWIPLSSNLVLAYGDEVNQREVIRVSVNKENIVFEELGSFKKFMSDKYIEVLEVNQEEQAHFATNLLNLGNRTLLLALSINKRVNVELEKRGFRILSAELNKLVNGYGAVHCLTAPVVRSKL